MSEDSTARTGVDGVTEGVKGKAKELAGLVLLRSALLAQVVIVDQGAGDLLGFAFHAFGDAVNACACG